MKRTILHPTDFSPASRAAFTHALALARQERAELVLVHVLPTAMPMVGEGYMSPQTFDDLQRSMRAQAQKQLDRLVAKAKTARVRARGLLYEGVAADAIARAARSRRAKLIVMGTHGRTGLSRLFMGSVAERVIGTAHCPVLTVRGK
ncbi:MAG TPA: universal stress protein [Candidatus Acidoferrum sp.]|nr:universal stress protein [Candidatus Acidoferrum sp.]